MTTESKIHSHSFLKCAFSVAWQSEHASHRDVRVFEKFNVWRDLDLLPIVMQNALPDKTIGYKNQFAFNKAELVEAWQASRVYRVNRDQFRTQTRQGFVIEPHVGRFYPRGRVSGIADNYSDNMHPCRLVDMDPEHMGFDFNHPMAQYDVTLGVEVYDIMPSTGEHGGRCNDAIADLLTGPGMQARYPGLVTDFFTDKAFDRDDSAADNLFYAQPRMVDHLDKTALQQVHNLYAELVPANARVLDLMASCNSHLPKTHHACHVTGLGLNQQELASNSLLDERIIHDLNQEPRLPFDDAWFDCVICTASVEYLIRPFDVFKEVARILKPGGRFINVFSNRWFPPKAIAIWSELHEFERMGLVTEYYLQSGYFSDINTGSLRGLSRPEDDKYSLQLAESDPVYAVWGTRNSTGF